MRKLFTTLSLAAMFFLYGCHYDDALFETVPTTDYLAENVVIIVIDGPRYQETWGDNYKLNIPVQSELAKQGVFFRNFFNEGVTYTVSGHTAITTGFNQNVKNNGSELPENPSIFQAYLSHSKYSPDEAWIITSKLKLDALCDSKAPEWRGSYLPSRDIEDREDSVTFQASLKILEEHQPSLSLIQFKGPDKYGHEGDWTNYIATIQETDFYVGEIWKFIQSHPHYKNKTALFVTNDHGRHLDGVGSGFKDHGDKCEGCKHISLLALGPDFDTDKVIDEPYGQTDISPTVAELLGFPWISEGQKIKPLLNR